MAHALLSPSSASKWLNCPPSARLEASLPSYSGIAAAEGTLAHELCELLLKLELGKINKADYLHDLIGIKSARYFNGSIVHRCPPDMEGGEELYDEAMYDHAVDYVALVMEHYQELKQLDPLAEIHTEKQFDLSKYVPEGFGTCDTPIVAEPVLWIHDLKYGKGVPVSSEGNKQMMLYALGAYIEYSLIYEIKEIRMTVVQPRIDNTSTAIITKDELLTWAETELKEKAAQAFKGEGEMKAGNHCQFCGARAQCRVNAQYQMQAAEAAFKEPVLLSDAEIVNILERKKAFEGWLTSIAEFAQSAALSGKQFPGMKLVEGRSNRMYRDKEEVIKLLLQEDYFLEDIASVKPLGLGEMEKKLGKTVFTELLTPLIIKPAGKPTLVPESDKRPAIKSAEDAEKAFADSE